MADKERRKEVFVSVSKSGNFLNAAYENYMAEPNKREELPLEIAALHNDGHIDLVSEFSRLENTREGSSKFFTTLHIFEKALPNLIASIRDVMRCVLHLHKAAGQDMAAGIIFNAYIAHCEKDPTRPLEAMRIIEIEHEQFADMLPATVAAGSRANSSHYLSELIRFCQHPAPVFRKRAIFSLSSITWPKGASVPKEALACLESAATENEDETLANVITSAFKFYQQDKTTEALVTQGFRTRNA
ncbi:MAG: hypothetical protein Q8Q80_11515 [Methyloversatilis sp.]|uniref:hypothetical protein n=1 Tax=Methyloversatilis sp. TaxID=2569862 RepID=UPI0027366AC4|nr:hypothetical protein [Methyloversatilis sp.]MDP3873279.1 hypothetical protein [Methyloversatilis sp.]